ncbi:MAG: transposase [Chloroflexi bacterium]|nr:transposase [Chloroflexota bacterium]
MADTVGMALAELVRKAEQNGEVGFLRDGVRVLSQALMEVAVSQHLSAERHARTAERSGQRNGYRERERGTRVVTIGPRVPRRQDGTPVGRRSAASRPGRTSIKWPESHRLSTSGGRTRKRARAMSRTGAHSRNRRTWHDACTRRDLHGPLLGRGFPADVRAAARAPRESIPGTSAAPRFGR